MGVREKGIRQGQWGARASGRGGGTRGLGHTYDAAIIHCEGGWEDFLGRGGGKTANLVE